MMSTPRASIIVCTLNRAGLLMECLQSILDDTSSVSRELIVVDNGSTDRTAELVRGIAASSGDLTVCYVAEPRRGQSHARNAGVAAARGDLLFFTDDDVCVNDRWSDALAAAFDDPSVGAAGGRILTRWDGAPPGWMDASLTGVVLPDYGPDPRVFDGVDLPIGANMALRRSAFKAEAAVFDPRLGNRGDFAVAAEEMLLMEQIRTTHRIVYVPQAVVWHRVPTERLERDWLRRVYFQHGIGWARKAVLQGKRPLFLPIGVRRAIRTANGARSLKRRNDRASRLTPSDVRQELDSYAWAGHHLELVLGRWPRLANWVASHLGR